MSDDTEEGQSIVLQAQSEMLNLSLLEKVLSHRFQAKANDTIVHLRVARWALREFVETHAVGDE